MIDFIPYGFLPYYPHMSVADTLIWERYMRKEPKAFDQVSYDVPVGAGAEFDMTAGGILGEGIKKLYQRKIDVVAMKDGRTYLVELKPRASTASIGQIKGYAALFKRDHKEYPNPTLILLTDSLVPEMDFLTKEEGIEMRFA